MSHSNQSFIKTTKTKVKSEFSPSKQVSKPSKGKTWERQNKRAVEIPNRF